MRKIFLDCGANVGQSLEAFCNGQPDIAEYEIFCFEASQNTDKIIEPLNKQIKKHNKKAKSVSFINKAIWIENGSIDFYDDGSESSSISDRYCGDGRKMSDIGKPNNVSCIDLSDWVQKNFSKDDHIILKLDIEGSEYEVFEKLCDDETIEWFDKIYCEIHGLKAGRTYKDTIRMIDQVNSHGKKLFAWANIKQYGKENWKDTEHGEKTMKREFHKWYMRSIKAAVFDNEGNIKFDLPFDVHILNSVISKLIDMNELNAEFINPRNHKRYRIYLDPNKPDITWECGK